MNESSNMEAKPLGPLMLQSIVIACLNYVICVYFSLVFLCAARVKCITMIRSNAILVCGNQTEVQWTYHLIAINLICIKNLILSFQFVLRILALLPTILQSNRRNADRSMHAVVSMFV